MEDCNELIADIENAFEAGNIDVSVAKNQIHVLFYVYSRLLLNLILFSESCILLDKHTEEDRRMLSDLLQSWNALDLSELFNSENIRYSELVNFNLKDYTNLGISSLRAQQFLDSPFLKKIKEKNEERIRLRAKLKLVECEQLFNALVAANFPAEKVLLLDNETLKNIGLSFQERKKVLKKLQDYKTGMLLYGAIISYWGYKTIVNTF